MSHRIDELLKVMTLEEKLGQLTQQAGSEVQDDNPVTKETKEADFLEAIRAGRIGACLGAHGAAYTNRLQKIAVTESKHGIPLILGNDVIHGYRTIFPINLGEASSWNPEQIERASRVAAIEASAAGTHWTFAPMVDVCRDPRWGRVAEGAGEDPYLGSAIAAARVRGFQGHDLSARDTILACAKHFVAYGGAEGGRDYNTVDISERTLREVYLPPFRASVEAGVGTLMSAFNEINGIPASGNRFTLKDILRVEWKFDGFVVSDWTSVTEMIAHGFASGDADAAEKAFGAGVDMEMSSFTYRTHLGEAVARGRVSEQAIDEAVRRVLKAKFQLGLFDRPFVDAEREKRLLVCDEHRAVAREMARQSIVLLKNENRILPLSDSEKKSIAVIGPLANSRKDPLGTWASVGKPEDVVTVLEGIRERAESAVLVNHAEGCGVSSASRDGFEEAVELAKQSDVVILVVGESEDMSGEAHSRSTLDLPGVQRDLVQAIHATGVPTIVVLMNGRPLSINWTAANVPAILEAWHLGVECGHAVADVLFGDFNPSGKLPVTFPRRVGQIPIYYNHKNTGRPPSDERWTSKYIDLPSTPLYPFGYGLSYTTFEYGNMNIEPARIDPHGETRVTVEVTNTGDRAGVDVVQLYIRDVVASVTRPVRQLRGFERVALASGEAKTVSFLLTPKHLGFYDHDMEYVVEPGVFKVWVARNAAEGVESQFEVIAD